MNKSGDSAFHVLLDGKQVGPYNRRTLVGMRLKHALNNDHVLVGQTGSRMTVAQLLSQRSPRESSFDPVRTSRSVVQATFTASLYGVEGTGFDIPQFDGEIEVRVQQGVLRMAGRFKQGGNWKDDRIKLPLANVMHGRAVGSRVDLWLKPPAAGTGKTKPPLQSLALELFLPESAGELLNYLPEATPPPNGLMAPQPASAKPVWLGWAAAIGVFVVLGLMAVVLLRQKLW